MSDTNIPDFNKKFKPTKKQIIILDNLRKCEKITEYLKLKISKDTTRRNYAGYIRDYFIKLDITCPDKYLQDPRRMRNGKQIDYLDKIETDVLKFNKSLQTKSGSNRKANLSAIRKLLEHNKIDLGNSFWEEVRKNGKKTYRETDTETPSKQQLKDILGRANEEAKAFFLMQMTSGSRLKEILYLTFDNLHLETEPPSFRVPSELSKNGKPITKFITPEAKYWVDKYRKNRDKILQTRINRARNKKTKEEYKNRVFPMGSSNPQVIWNNLLEKEGLHIIDPNTTYPTMGTHSLRRYFEDNIGHGKLAKYMSNKLSKSEEPYQYKTKNKLEQDEETAETKEEIENLKLENEKLEGKIKILIDGKKQTKNSLDIIHKQYEQTQEQLEKIGKELFDRIHPYPETDQDYYDFKHAEMTKDDVIFYDVTEKGEEYKITDPKRLKALKEHNKESIKYFRKQGIKEITK